MEINGSDTLTCMRHGKKLLNIIDYFNTEQKNGSDSKTCKLTFF